MERARHRPRPSLSNQYYRGQLGFMNERNVNTCVLQCTCIILRAMASLQFCYQETVPISKLEETLKVKLVHKSGGLKRLVNGDHKQLYECRLAKLYPKCPFKMKTCR